MLVVRVPPSGGGGRRATLRDLSVHTQQIMERHTLMGACTHRQLHDRAEVVRMHHHATVWRAAATVPYIVHEGEGDPPPFPALASDAEADVVLLRCCVADPQAAVRTGRRVATPGALTYAVCTERGSAALVAASRPYHMPVDMLLATLGELGDVRLTVAASVGGGGGAQPRGCGRGIRLAAGYKALLWDAPTQPVFRWTMGITMGVVVVALCVVAYGRRRSSAFGAGEEKAR